LFPELITSSIIQLSACAVDDIPPLPVFSKSLPEVQLNISADLKQTF